MNRVERFFVHWCVPTLLFLAAAFFRLVSLDLVSITADEGIHGMFAMNIAIFRDLPLVGLPSVGIRNSAFFVYFLSIPYMISRHPLAGVVFVSMLNLAALGLFYRLCLRRWGAFTSLTASTLYAFSPWAVMYARNMWPPSCVPLFTLLLIDRGLFWLDTGRARTLFWATLIAMLLPQLHFSGFCGPVWLAVVLWLGRKKISWVALLAAVAISVVLALPWLHYQHNINRWDDFSRVVNAAKGKHTVLETVSNITTTYPSLLGTGQFEYWFAKSPSQLPDYFSPMQIQFFHGALYLLSGLLLAAVVWSIRQPARDIRLLVFWCFLPLVMLVLIRPDIHPHYVGVAFPIPFVLIALFLKYSVELLGSRRWIGITVVSSGLVVTILCHSLFLMGWYHFVRDGNPDGQGHFQLSYRQRVEAGRSILKDCPQRVVLLAGTFTGLAPAYHLPYSYLQMKSGVTKFPFDADLRYWVDEGGPPVSEPGWVNEKQWNVGPTRIVRQRFDRSH